jgi:Immunoglobulin I-set domain
VKHWKFWIAIAFSVALVFVFQNCAGDYNSADYMLTAEDGPVGEENPTDVAIAPQMITALQNTTVLQSQSAAFSVSIRGNQLTYNWFKDNQPLAGINSNSFLLQNAQLSSAGTYKVVVSNSAGSVESSAVLTVTAAPITPPPPTAAPVITTPPRNADVFIYTGPGAPSFSHTFTVSATGANLTYQWFFKGISATAVETALAGQTLSSLRISPVRLSSAGTYRVVVTNPAGQATAQAIMTVESEPYGSGPLR